MKKYYAEFIHNGEVYITRFKAENAMIWLDVGGGCFVDMLLVPEDPLRVRSLTSIVTEAITGRVYLEWLRNEVVSDAKLISHEEYIERRARGFCKWVPVKEKFDGC